LMKLSTMPDRCDRCSTHLYPENFLEPLTRS
jgi:hypothetical protein